MILNIVFFYPFFASTSIAFLSGVFLLLFLINQFIIRKY